MTSKGNGSSRNGAAIARVASAEVATVAALEVLIAGQWTAGRSERELAERFGLTVEQARHAGEAAGRLVAESYGSDVEARRGMVLARLGAIREAALGQRRAALRKDGSVVEYDAPDFGAAIRATELEAKLLGVDVTKVDLTARNETAARTEELATGVGAWLAEHPETLPLAVAGLLEAGGTEAARALRLALTEEP